MSELNLLAEFRYGLYRLAGRTRDPIATKRSLRSVLRDYPRWRKGHLRLALAELESELQQQHARDFRAIGAAEVSLKAAQLLSEHPADEGLLALGAGLCSFLRADFVNADQHFSTAQSRGVPECYQVLLLEHAGAALVALQRGEAANELFNRIPPNKRSSYVRSILELKKSNTSD